MHSQTRSTCDQPFTKITVATAFTFILIIHHNMQVIQRKTGHQAEVNIYGIRKTKIHLYKINATL